MKNLGDYVNRLYRDIQIELPNEITFVTTQELEDKYPKNTPKKSVRNSQLRSLVLYLSRKLVVF